MFNDVYINKIRLSYLSKSSKAFTLSGSTVSFFQIQLDTPYQITVKAYSDTNNKSKFQRAILHSLYFYNDRFPKEAILHISQTDINNVTFNSFLNFGTIVFSDVQKIEDLKEFNIDVRKFSRDSRNLYDRRFIHKESAFVINNSDLGNTQFIGCDIAGFKRFEFLNSKMANVFLADTPLPHKQHINTAENANLDEQRRLALSQFKKIYERQGDVVRATQYRAEEMEVYRAQLKDNESNFPSNEWWNNKAERANLWLNKFSNYYGNNWLKAVAWTLLFNSILYTFYCWAQGYWFGGDWNTFWKLSAYSFEFLNPLRKADFLEHITGKHPGAGAIAIDYVSRIIIAYFVYQTITAFRKFGKSSV